MERDYWCMDCGAWVEHDNHTAEHATIGEAEMGYALSLRRPSVTTLPTMERERLERIIDDLEQGAISEAWGRSSTPREEEKRIQADADALRRMLRKQHLPLERE